MRSSIVAAACFLVASVPGCGPTNPGPSLGITPSDPSGTVQITGPTDFSAVLTNASGEVTWDITGGGTLSSTSGLHVSYTPPAGTVTATLTATAGTLKASVQIAASPKAIDIPNLTAPVTVQYDAQDIPHIRCAAMIDCIAAQGYLQARDRFFPMDFLRHVARGKLAELIGLDGLSQDVQLRTMFTTRAGHRLEDDLAASQDAPTEAMLTAFVGGINAHLHELKSVTGAQLPGEYAQLPFPIKAADIPDWTIEDTLAIARLQQFELSETVSEESAFGQFASVYAIGPKADAGKMHAWIRAAAPSTEQAHTLSPTGTHLASAAPAMQRATQLAMQRATQRTMQRATQRAMQRATQRGRLPGLDPATWKGALAQVAASTTALHDRLRPANGSVGSNNWAVSAAKSATGVAMVANDPHLPLQYPPLFHLSVMTSTNPADNLDLAGGAFPGVPGALVGRGAHVGWGVTVVGYDVTDLYMETLDVSASGCSPSVPCVDFNSQKVPMLVAPQSYKVRTGPGASGLVDSTTLPLPAASKPPAAVLIVPHHGPIIQLDASKGTAISVRWTGHEGNTHDVKAFLGLNTAANVDAAVAALEDYATGAQNFVLADDQGHIAYDPHALVPVRSFADIRVKGAGVIPPWFPLPGDGSAEWGDGTPSCAAATLTPVPASCWIADDQLPHGKDPAKGYFFTANADPTSPSVSDDNSPLAHPPYLSFDWDDSSGFRATRIEQMLDAAIAAHGTVSLADMQAMQTDHVSRPGKVFTDYIAQIPTSGSSPPELTAAKGILGQWATNGFDCPSGLLGSDPKHSPADTNATVVQNSSACFLFHEFLRILATNVFTDDLKVVGQGVNGLLALKAMLYMLDPATPAADTTFCNDVDATGTVTVHTCAEQVATALVQAVDTLSRLLGPDPKGWVWGRVHTIQPVSLLPLVTTNFQPGPYARPGGAFTVDVGNPSLSGGGLDFTVGAGSNVRHISLMDPARPVVKMQLPGPERDGPTVFVGPDLLGQWVQNKYFDFAFGNQIDAVAVSSQTFKAP